MNARKEGAKFNVIDALILFFVLAFLVLLIYMIFFSDIDLLKFFRQDENQKTISYTLEIAPVDDDFLDASRQLPIQVGDRFYHVDGAYRLGRVTGVGEAGPYLVSTVDASSGIENSEGSDLPETGGMLQYAPYPGKSVITLTVEAEAVYNGSAYLVKGKALRIGDSFTFSTPYFTGTCRCIAVEEVNENGGS